MRGGTLDVLKENYEEKYVIVKTSNRSKPLKVFVKPFSNNPFWFITYEDGTSLPELSGAFTDKRSAFYAIKMFEDTEPMSRKEYQDKVMGLEGKKPPVLKTKKVKRKKNLDDSAGI
jgi:hypothetical protein